MSNTPVVDYSSRTQAGGLTIAANSKLQLATETVVAAATPTQLDNGAYILASGPLNNGLILVSAAVGSPQWIVNTGANRIFLYPATGESFFGGTANTPIALTPSQPYLLLPISSNQWTVVTPSFNQNPFLGGVSWSQYTGAAVTIASNLTANTFMASASGGFVGYPFATPSSAPSAFTVVAQNTATGTLNVSGGSLVLAAGLGTGTGDSEIDFQIAPAGTSGTSQNTLTTVAKLNTSGFTLTPSAPFFLQANAVFGIDATSNTTLPTNVTVRAGNTVAGGTADQNGGTLTFAAGQSKGAGNSQIVLEVAGIGTAGQTTLNGLFAAATIGQAGITFGDLAHGIGPLNLNAGNTFFNNGDIRMAFSAVQGIRFDDTGGKTTGQAYVTTIQNASDALTFYGNINTRNNSTALLRFDSTTGAFRALFPQNVVMGLDATSNTTTPTNITVTAGNTVAGGTADQAGGTLTLQAGQGKGLGDSQIVLKIAPAAGSSGTSLNAEATVLTVESTGLVVSSGFPLNMGANKITNLATPTVSTDAATKGYVDAAAPPSMKLVAASNFGGF